MKTNAIIRIVLFSLAILVLLGLLLSVLAFGRFMFDTDSFAHSTTSEVTNLPIVSNGMTTQGAADADQIRNLDIEWVSGSIVIQPDANATDITISETYVDSAKDQMVYKQSGNTLEIQYCKDSISFPSFGINIDFSKDLVITVPMNWICDSLEIDTASARVDVTDLTIHEFGFNGASGLCNITNCNIDEIDLDTVSGDVTFVGTLEVLDCDAASANCHITVTNIPRSIDIDSASGDLELLLPDNCGFSCNLNTMSGRFSSEFPTTNQNGHHVYGDGSCAISLDAMSGNVKICRSGDSAPMITEPVQACTDPNCTDTSHNHSAACTEANCENNEHNHGESHHK